MVDAPALPNRSFSVSAVDPGELDAMQKSFARFEKEGLMPRDAVFNAIFSDILPQQFWNVRGINRSLRRFE